jgi:hypothetical protein
MEGTSGAQTAGRRSAPIRPRKCFTIAANGERVWRSGPRRLLASQDEEADLLMPAPPPSNGHKIPWAPISAIAASQSRNVARRVESQREARSASHSGCGDPRAPSSQRDAPLAVGTDFLQRRSAGVRAGLRSQGEHLDARSPRRWEPAGLPATGSRRGSEPRWGRSPRRPRLGALGRAMGAGGLPRAPSPCPTFHCTHRNAKRSSSSLWAMGLRHAGRLLRE